MITKKLENIIEKYKITKTNQIIYGTNIPQAKAVIPTPWATYISFEQSNYYFFYFDENGIVIYPIDGEDYAMIPWSDVVDFKMSHIFILGKMMIQTKDNTYKFQINRRVVGCPWIKNNLAYLEENHYFYKK